MGYFRELVIWHDKLIIMKNKMSKSHAQFIEPVIILLETSYELTYLQVGQSSRGIVTLTRLSK